MKIRLHEGSVRLRLGEEEVAAIARGTRVSTITRFPDGSCLECSVALGDAEPSVSFAEMRLAVEVPRARAQSWAEGEEISMEWQLAVTGGALRLLVEKDLPCSHRPSVPDITKEST